jgi:hypothetical protein
MAEPDPLLEQIKRITETTDKIEYEREKRHAHSTVGRVERDTVAFHRFAYQVGQVGTWLARFLVLPLCRALYRVGHSISARYVRTWDRVVHVNDKYGERAFSKGRALAFLAGTIVLVLLLPFFFDTILYFATAKREIVYLNNSQEILPIEGVHSVQGCLNLPCTEKDSIYYRVRPTLFNEVWSILHHGTWFFPDYVAAAVPPVVSRCEAITYGVRVKLFVRGTNIYPDLIDVSCQPLGS